VHRSANLGIWVLTRYDDCVQVLRDHDVFSSDAHNATGMVAALQAQSEAETGGPAARTVLGSDPPEHTRLRGLINKAFTPRRVEEMRDHITDVADAMLDAAPADQPFDVISGLAQPLPIIIIAEMLGVPATDREQFKTWSALIAEMTSLMRPPDVNAKVAVARKELRAYFSDVIQQRRAQPQDDLISALVQAQDGADQLDDEELLGFCILLLVAGNETTTNLIGNGALALAQHPEQAEVLASDSAVMSLAVEEFLRYDSPVQATVRHAVSDTEVGGTAIAKGESVMAIVGAANRDPDQFDDPDALDLRRTENRHLSFGHGIHYCVGSPLARLEAEVAFDALLKRSPTLTLADAPLEYGGTFILRGLKKLIVSPLRA
jgi:cytochrome P450